MRGDYELRARAAQRQESLPLSEAPDFTPSFQKAATTNEAELSATAGLSAAALALLGIVTELAGRYGPEHLAVSVGSERVGLAGWIIDQALGTATDIDEGSARLEIAALCERGLVELNAARRLEATPRGAHLWQEVKPAKP